MAIQLLGVLLAAAALWQAPPQALDSGAPRLKFLVPWEEAAAPLQLWLRARPESPPLTVKFLDETELRVRHAKDVTVLVGYRQPELDRLVRSGQLAEWDGVSGEAVAWLFWESWAPVIRRTGSWSDGLLNSWQDLLDEHWRGGVYLRFPEPKLPEGLILGQLAKEWGLQGRDIRQLVFDGGNHGSNIFPTHATHDQILTRLPEGSVALVPVRVAAAANRESSRFEAAAMEDGWWAIAVGVAYSKKVPAELRPWIAEVFRSPDSLGELSALLDLEPRQPVGGSLPEWMKEATERRRPIDLGATLPLRDTIANLYADQGEGSPQDWVGFFEKVFEWIMLLFFAGFLIIAARMSRTAKQRKRATA